MGSAAGTQAILGEAKIQHTNFTLAALNGTSKKEILRLNPGFGGKSDTIYEGTLVVVATIMPVFYHPEAIKTKSHHSIFGDSKS